LVLYVRALERDQKLIFVYRVRAVRPAQATVPPARVHEYYTPTNRATTKGFSLTVVGKGEER
jgi:uncharacterized protein YfaS (alpha-2-macroglobulin family)